MERKNITIRDDQNDWINEHSVNLSWFVQKCIDKTMELQSFDANDK